MSVAVTGSGVAIFLWYVRSGGATVPRSPLGLAFALLSTGCFTAAAAGYSRVRRRSARAIGQLNAALQWHAFFAAMGLVFALMHSFGHLEKISGTLALFGLIAVAASGFIGRVLDRVLPRLIALEVHRALTGQGEDVLAAVYHQAREGAGGAELRLPANVLEYVVRGSVEALSRERRYRALLRAWRVLHVAVVIVAIGLICWHLIYAAQVLFFS
ncbi:MAG: hypothetical protein ACRDOE_00050 [Streptosporangiaceae bacterium]